MREYKDKFDELLRLDTTRKALYREPQSVRIETMIIKISSRMRTLKAEMTIMEEKESLTYFDCWIKSGSMRVNIPPKFIAGPLADLSQIPPPVESQIFEGTPLITGEPVQDIRNVAAEAGALARRVLMA